ncbi:MAG: hypothetical protein AB7P52_05235 [Alphaproteobacteria bacterium]
MKNKPNYLTIDYKALGTISLEELRQAVLTDLAAMGDILNIEFTTGAKLLIPITNEYGDPVRFSELTNRSQTRIDTHHYRPACKDYEL